MDDPFKPVSPTVAPGMTIDPVPNSDVIETYHQVLHSLLVAYQEVIGGDPVPGIPHSTIYNCKS